MRTWIQRHIKAARRDLLIRNIASIQHHFIPFAPQSGSKPDGIVTILIIDWISITSIQIAIGEVHIKTREPNHVITEGARVVSKKSTSKIGSMGQWLTG